MGLCGLPPPNGALPQSPLHVRSLRGVGEKGHLRESSEPRVLEQRLSNLLQSLFVGLCLFLGPVLSLIPRSLLWGYFLFMAAGDVYAFVSDASFLFGPLTRLWRACIQQVSLEACFGKEYY